MAFRHRGKSWLPWVGLAASLIVIGAAAVVVVLSGREGDTNNPDVEFSDTQTTPSSHRAVQKPPKRGHPADDGFSWPIFGLDKSRTRVLALDQPFRPPFRKAWRYSAEQLLEFTPVICGRSLFLLGDDGDLFKISRWTGQIQWRRKLGTLAAASPACTKNWLYVVVLRRRGSNDGAVFALDTDKGRIRWKRDLPSRSESSPLLHGNKLIFGTEDGTVYALRPQGGRLVWKFRASGAVKGAVAYANGRLFFGTYGGRVYAIGPSSGRQIWNKHVAAGGAFGLGSGNFYSSPAVAYGRVYIGSTNGAVYSLSARTGAVGWRKHTGNYVYGSPAVGAVSGGPPTVWIGSYNGNLYGLDARDGSVRWSRRLGGKLSGSPTVIGDLVFQASFDKRTTWAVGANTGRILWKRNRGSFTSVISDGRRIYFLGYATLYALDPKGRRFAKQPLPRSAPKYSRFLERRRLRALERQRAEDGAKPRAGKKQQGTKEQQAAKKKRAAKRRAKARYCKRHPRAKRCR